MKLWVIIAKHYHNREKPPVVVDVQLSEQKAYDSLCWFNQLSAYTDLMYEVQERES